MRITPQQRADIETALDELALLMGPAAEERVIRAAQLYQRAVAIVREKPAGYRKVRSDAGALRPSPQIEARL